MNDDDLTRQLREAEGPVAPSPRFADRLYADLAIELALPSARRRAMAPARQRPARRGMTLMAAALLLVALGMVGAVLGASLLPRPVVVAPAGDWSGFRGDAARRGAGTDGPVGEPVPA